MTKDLEETLKELGPGYRTVVDRLLAAYAPEIERSSAADRSAPVPRNRSGFASGWGMVGLVAAVFLLFLGISALFRPSTPSMTGGVKTAYTVAYEADPRALAQIVATQRADGSWANDFLTRQNAAALANATRTEERIAYKKAIRYLRSKGLRPLSAAELKVRADTAARVLASNAV